MYFSCCVGGRKCRLEGDFPCIGFFRCVRAEGKRERESESGEIQTYRQTDRHSDRENDRGEGDRELVSWCFEPSQPQRITSGETFIKT